LWIGYNRRMPENKDWRGFPRIPLGNSQRFGLVRSVRDLLERRYPLLWVAGEISNFTVAKSGHAYFVLKDEHTQVRCVMFRQRQQNLEWTPRDGMQIEVQALVSLYEPRGEFQLTVETMRRAVSARASRRSSSCATGSRRRAFSTRPRNGPCPPCRAPWA